MKHAAIAMTATAENAAQENVHRTHVPHHVQDLQAQQGLPEQKVRAVVAGLKGPRVKKELLEKKASAVKQDVPALPDLQDQQDLPELPGQQGAQGQQEPPARPALRQF